MAGREDLAPKGLDILTRDVSLDEIQSLFDITTGHDHDGTNSALVSWNNIADKPSGLYYSLTAPTNEFTSSDDGVGNLTLSWKTQSAGLVLASPTASSGTPSFRSLIISDIPTITLAKLDNIASGSILGRKTALTGEVEALTITDIKTMLDVINYGVCTTDGATVNKTVDITNFALSLGTKVTVKFDNANSVSNPTLNVSSTGAKAIYNGSSAIDSAMLEAGKIYDFVYDGTNYVLISGSGSVTTPISKTTSATVGQTEFTYTTVDGWTDDLLGLLVFRNGVYMTPTTDYSIDNVNKKITFESACEAGEIISVIFNNSGAVDVAYTPADASETVKGVVKVGDSLSSASGVLSVVAASTAVKGVVKVGANINVTDGVISVPDTTATTKGVVKVGANINVTDGVISVPNASSTVKGVIELATDAEVIQGSDTERAVTPAGLLAGFPTRLRSNLLGTVSETDGVPTGAVIESGSNANGEYVKFADGTMMCYKYVLYTNLDLTSRCMKIEILPISVLSTTNSFASVSGNCTTVGGLTTSQISLRSLNSVDVDLYLPSGATSSMTIKVCIFVIGRWF